MKVIRVNGTSMWPALQSGDYVVVESVDDLSQFASGDLVLRMIDGDAVLHRYLGEGSTKGDRFTVADPPGESPLFIVRRVLPARHATRPGKFRSASESSWYVRRLSLAQAYLSRRQLKARSKFKRRLGTLALIANGFAIRATYLASLGANQDAMP